MQVKNDKARKYLMNMRRKIPVIFTQKFPNAHPLALKLLQRLLAFDPKDRPSAEEVLFDHQILIILLKVRVYKIHHYVDFVSHCNINVAVYYYVYQPGVYLNMIMKKFESILFN